MHFTPKMRPPKSRTTPFQTVTSNETFATLKYSRIWQKSFYVTYNVMIPHQVLAPNPSDFFSDTVGPQRSPQKVVSEKDRQRTAGVEATRYKELISKEINTPQPGDQTKNDYGSAPPASAIVSITPAFQDLNAPSQTAGKRITIGVDKIPPPGFFPYGLFFPLNHSRATFRILRHGNRSKVRYPVKQGTWALHCWVG